MPELCVVIPTLGNPTGLARVLAGFDRQTVPAGSFEVIVVCDLADPEPDRTREVCVPRGYRIDCLLGPAPGASANRNAGAGRSAAPLILFCDDDTVPTPELVAEHLAWHRREPAAEVAILGLVRWAPSITVTPFMHWLDHGIQFDFPNIDRSEAGWGRFYSSNVSLKRALFDSLGGYDAERLPYGYEDLDLGYRASKHGLRLLYNPLAIVDHEREMDLELWRRRVGRIARAERAFCAKHPEIAPYFHRLFADAAARPRARGRGRRWIRAVPRRTPWLGPYLWTSADLYYRQQLAPGFLKAWESAAESDRSAAGASPEVRSRSSVGESRSSGSDRAGPK